MDKKAEISFLQGNMYLYNIIVEFEKVEGSSNLQDRSMVWKCCEGRNAHLDMEAQTWNLEDNNMKLDK